MSLIITLIIITVVVVLFLVYYVLEFYGVFRRAKFMFGKYLWLSCLELEIELDEEFLEKRGLSLFG